TSRSKASGSSDTVWGVSITGASTFTKAWSKPLGDVDASIMFTNSTLYVGNITGQVSALVPATGVSKWLSSFSTGDGAVKSTVWFNSNRVYFSTSTKVWSITDGGLSTNPVAFWSSPVALSNPSNPIVIGTNVYAGAGDGKLYRIDAAVASPT